MRILTWNAFGGDSAALAKVLVEKEIDLCVLQEAKMKADDPWYAPLGQLGDYRLRPPEPENVSHRLPGGILHPAEGSIRAYAIVSRKETVGRLDAELVDYTRDGHWGPMTPRYPSRAADEGYNQRPPLKITLGVRDRPVVVFTWHAPVGSWNHSSFEMLEKSRALADALAEHTAIAGDLNANSLFGYFDDLPARLQRPDSRLDHVLANTKPSNLAEIPGVDLKGVPHKALAAEVTW